MSDWRGQRGGSLKALAGTSGLGCLEGGVGVAVPQHDLEVAPAPVWGAEQ